MRKVDARGRRTKGLRAVLVARVSTLKPSQDKSGPRQLAELREHARALRWPVVASFCDRITGADMERPGLLQALDLITTHRADVLVVHDLDRMGRDVPGMLRTADRITGAGGHLAIRDLHVDTTTNEGRLAFTVMAAAAEFQRRNNVDKVLSGLRHARKKGVRLGRPPLPPAVVERARELRKEEKSWTKIADKLRAEKLADGTNLRTTIRNAVARAEKAAPRKSRPPSGPRRRSASPRS
jgi:DNA invertase Pin-like site-specific DNA recombinase